MGYQRRVHGKRKIYSNYYKLIILLWLNMLLTYPNINKQQNIFNQIYENKMDIYYSNNTNKIFLFCMLNVMKQTENSYSKILQKNNNKINHMINGNKIKNTKLNLLQFNKGSANFENKINNINEILQTHQPDVMCVSEANLNISKLGICDKFPNHNIELNKMSKIIDISRNIILIDNKLSYKRRYDLEDNNTCTIWLQINIPKKKPILIMGGYRQWQLLKSLDNTNTKHPKKQ